jgi:carboxyl-terminal processing protease
MKKRLRSCCLTTLTAGLLCLLSAVAPAQTGPGGLPSSVPPPPVSLPQLVAPFLAPLSPQLPAINQLQQGLFPNTQPQTAQLNPAQQVCKAFVESFAENHFLLHDPQQREAWRKEWTAKIDAIKTLDEADALCRKAMASLGQRFDYYLDPDELAAENSVSDPTFVGVGIAVKLKDQDLIVDALPEKTTWQEREKALAISDAHPLQLDPYKDGPAFKDGIRGGDILRQVDGKDINGMTIPEVIKLIKGKEGSRVQLTVDRIEDGKTVSKTLTVTRGKFTVPVVESRLLPDGVTYVRLENFMAEKAAEELLAALKEAAKVQNGKLILDLRGNGGGRLDHAINMVAYMLEDGRIVTLRNRVGDKLVKTHHMVTPDVLTTTKPAPWNPDLIQFSATKRILAIPPTMPIVVLIDGNSASASELLSGALQFHGRAKIVGQNSRGKGVGQVLIELGEKRLVHITNFYFDPAGREIDFEGIHPDSEASLEPAYAKLKELRAKLRETLSKLDDASKKLEAASGPEKDALDKEVAGLKESLAQVRKELAEHHLMLRENDPQLQEAQKVVKEEFERIAKELAQRKAKRDAAVKQKQEEWEKEKKAREEALSSQASSDSDARPMTDVQMPQPDMKPVKE